MRRSFGRLLLAAALGGLFTGAGGAQTSVKPVPAPGVKQDDVVCCKLGARTWRTTRQACGRAKGKAFPKTTCGGGMIRGAIRPLGARPGGPKVSPGIKKGVPICCRKGAKKWMTVLGTCKSDGGRMVPQHQCAQDTCCHVGSARPFLTTAQRCAQRRGTSLPHTFCHGGAGREVCCRVPSINVSAFGRTTGGPVYMITTKLKCRTGRGAEVADAECEKRGKYGSREVCCRTQINVFGGYSPPTYERKPLNQCRPLGAPVADRECTPEVDGDRQVCCRPVGTLGNLSSARGDPYFTKRRLCGAALGREVADSECRK